MSHTLVGAGALQRAILLRLRVSPSVTDPIDSYYLYRLKLYALAVKKHVDLYASRLEHTYWPWTSEARRFSKAAPDTRCASYCPHDPRDVVLTETVLFLCVICINFE